MNIGTMKIDTSFLKRPHAFIVYGLVLLTVVAVFYPPVKGALMYAGVVFVGAMMRFVGRCCDAATRRVEQLNCLLCIVLLIGGLLK